MDVIVCVALGAASGALGVAAYRLRIGWLGWLALAPLATAVYDQRPLTAAIAGFVCGSLVMGVDRQLSVPPTVPRAKLVETTIALSAGMLWGLVFGAAAWVWPNGVPAWGLAVMPAGAATVSLIHRLGSPRYWSWFLGSQDETLPVVHIARLGTDLVIPALLALAAATPVVVLVEWPPSAATTIASGAAVLLIAAALAFGRWSFRRAVREVELGRPVRVAAVSVSPPEFDEQARAYRDVDAAIARYQPYVEQAAAQGARLIVLPEYAVEVTDATRSTWLNAVSRWATETRAVVVAGLGALDPARDQLVIADETGRLSEIHDKQHPAPGLEPKPEQRTPPALLQRDAFPVSAVVCVDLDYPDLLGPVARAAGVLAVPANDWPEIFGMHHRSAVWSAVQAGVPVVRSAGHGISAVYDAAGRVVAAANSQDGPVVLVADVPASRSSRGDRHREAVANATPQKG